MPRTLFQQTFAHLVDTLRDNGSTPLSPPPLHPAPSVPAQNHPSSLPVPTSFAQSTPSARPTDTAPDPTPPAPASNRIEFVLGRKSGSENAILAGQRYFREGKRGEKEYWKCILFRDGCRPGRVFCLHGVHLAGIPIFRSSVSYTFLEST